MRKVASTSLETNFSNTNQRCSERSPNIIITFQLSPSIIAIPTLGASLLSSSHLTEQAFLRTACSSPVYFPSLSQLLWCCVDPCICAPPPPHPHHPIHAPSGACVGWGWVLSILLVMVVISLGTR